MTLHEQYQALIGRGMPEHPRYKWFHYKNDDYLLESAYNPDVPKRYDQLECPLDGHVLTPADARDLVTMHAVKWLLETFKDAEIGWETCWAFEKARIVDNTRLNAQGCPTEYKAADHSILDAILAATAHLEPKTT